MKLFPYFIYWSVFKPFEIKNAKILKQILSYSFTFIGNKDKFIFGAIQN